jgi:hypothetical protein
MQRRLCYYLGKLPSRTGVYTMCHRTAIQSHFCALALLGICTGYVTEEVRLLLLSYLCCLFLICVSCRPRSWACPCPSRHEWRSMELMQGCS